MLTNMKFYQTTVNLLSFFKKVVLFFVLVFIASCNKPETKNVVKNDIEKKKNISQFSSPPPPPTPFQMLSRGWHYTDYFKSGLPLGFDTSRYRSLVFSMPNANFLTTGKKDSLADEQVTTFRTNYQYTIDHLGMTFNSDSTCTVFNSDSTGTTQNGRWRLNSSNDTITIYNNTITDSYKIVQLDTLTVNLRKSISGVAHDIFMHSN